MPTVKCYGLLRCKNRNCPLANLEQVMEIPRKLWNRDMAAVLNFRRILMSLRETAEKKRQNQNEGNNSKSPPKLSLWLFNAVSINYHMKRPKVMIGWLSNFPKLYIHDLRKNNSKE
ncbi:uncharacterized protein BX663DRAFT_490098 [Cokeromyces recurvatus]|uniref:uncharacterized protein n=1 Tax=Cokeromyces recurvatus TaxID=90255 RepID=UPI00221F76BA|nr:uncharacterized protein BX663DRAFT_490098 [Cokeromyces recurvatus]KAI7898396.1 hypothetical protein BX663DRAFT_490098 [Cokeromyces recurvatus]